MTRILSVFNLLKRVGFAILSWGISTMLYTITLLLFIAGLAHAQDIIWVRNGDTANSHFGGFIFPLGDQNDDGFDDWAVYASGNAN
ncbi:hypothetical protein HUU59_13140, partial [bacterium]|nr:hypothetical protein [bacterium]